MTTVTMDAAKTCTATFNLQQITLTINKSGNGIGTVTSAPAGINCGATCNAGFDINSMVTLTATPNGDSLFTGFTGAGCADGTVTMDAAKSCGAEFVLRQFSVDVVINNIGIGQGMVTYSPGGAVCPGDCSETFNVHTAVTLTPTPIGNSVFGGWSENCPGGVIADLTSDVTCTATFTPNQFTLDINLAGTGVGNVSGAGLDCGDGGADCMETYNFGTVVNLVPTPDAVSTFVGFTGDSDCADGVVTIDADTTCTATFDLSLFTLTVAKIGTGTGTVTSAPVGINCGADCSEAYIIDTVVFLTPTPDTGSHFAGWTGDPDCADGTVSIDMDIICTAAFNRNIPPPNTADVSVIKSASPNPVNVGSELTYSFMVQNGGPDTAPGVQLADTLPEGVTFVSASAGCANNSGTITCALGSIPNGGSAFVSIVVIPTQPGSITNSATANSFGVIDPSNGNNTSTITTEVIGEEEPEFLTVEPDSENITTEPGGTVSIPVEINNPDTTQTNIFIDTNQTVTGAILTVDIPEDFSIEELLSTKGVCDIELGQCEIGDIVPGEIVTVVVDAVASDMEGVFNVSFTVSTTTGQTFTGSATVDVSGGGVVEDGEGSGGGCAVAGTTKGSLPGLLLYALIPGAIVARRKIWKK